MMSLVHILLVVFIYSINSHNEASIKIKVRLTSNTSQQENLAIAKSSKQATITSVLYQLQIDSVDQENSMVNDGVFFVSLKHNNASLTMSTDDFLQGLIQDVN